MKADTLQRIDAAERKMDELQHKLDTVVSLAAELQALEQLKAEVRALRKRRAEHGNSHHHDRRRGM